MKIFYTFLSKNQVKMYHAIIGKRPEKVELHFSLEAILI